MTKETEEVTGKTQETTKEVTKEMTVDEWKGKLTTLCESVVGQYKDAFEHLGVVDQIDFGGTDPDEVKAFMTIKLTKMQADIEEMGEEFMRS